MVFLVLYDISIIKPLLSNSQRLEGVTFALFFENENPSFHSHHLSNALDLFPVFLIQLKVLVIGKPFQANLRVTNTILVRNVREDQCNYHFLLCFWLTHIIQQWKKLFTALPVSDCSYRGFVLTKKYQSYGAACELELKSILVTRNIYANIWSVKHLVDFRILFLSSKTYLQFWNKTQSLLTFLLTLMSFWGTLENGARNIKLIALPCLPLFYEVWNFKAVEASNETPVIRCTVTSLTY